MKNEARRKLPPLPVHAARVLARLKRVRGLNDAEKSVHALGLAATPQERWDLFEKSVRSLGYWKRSKRSTSSAFPR
jgi:hypothetical protein